MRREPVLDVGAAQGLLGRLLRRDGLTIDAVEPDPAWADDARPYYRSVVAAAIEDAPLPDATYRVVVCADVLEHTVDPVGVLRKLQRAATPDAEFIVSLPNVAHLSARLLLLSGRFPQMERGIFDRTHLHFYTRRTALEMLAAAGLEPMRVASTPVPLEQVWPPDASRTLLRALMRMQGLALAVAPGLFAFQWLILARRPRTSGAGESDQR